MPKKIATFFSYIFYVKNRYESTNTWQKNIFKRRKHASLKASNIDYFWNLTPPPQEFSGYHLTIHSLTLRKRYAQKTPGYGIQAAPAVSTCY